MLKAIIVDDEKYICTLIRGLVDWDSIGIKVVGEEMNGKNALKLILKEKPDIVISDIRMPGIDGLELVKKVRELNIKTTFILISGHKEFQYAYSAIKYGVEYYMLKPINKDELIRNLVLIKNGLLQEQENNLKISKVAERSRKNFLTDLVHSPEIFFNKDEETIFQEYLLLEKYQNYKLALFKLDYKINLDEMQKHIIINQLNNFISHDSNPGALEIETLKLTNQILVQLYYSDKKNLDSFYKLIDTVQKKYFEYCYITVGLGLEVSSVKDLVFEPIRNAIICRMAVGCNTIIEIDKLNYKPLSNLSDTDLNQLQKYIEIADSANIITWFENIKESMLSAKYNPVDQFKQALYCADYIIAGLSRLFNKEPDVSFSLEYLYEKIYDASTRLKLFNSIKSYTINEIENFKKMKSAEDTKYVRVAKQYIEQHYNENISLNDIASNIYISPAYFSSLFKKQEGKNFSDYLIEYRINLAKKLLKNLQLNISEVGSKVGYHNSKYFSKLFYKTVGIRPSEYRKLFS